MITKMGKWFGCVGILVGAWCHVARGNLTVSGYDAPTNDRLTNSPSFLASDYDFSAVGNISSTGASTGRWATLVSPSYFVSAYHYHPANGDIVKFYDTNDSAGASYTGTVQSGVRIGSTDLWLGKFSSQINSAIEPMPILNYIDAAGSVGDDIFVYGAPHRVGTNEVDFLSSYSFGGSTGDILGYFYDPAVENDARIESGDSGGPTLIVAQGQLALLGIHWFQFGLEDGTTGSADTFVPSYINQMQAQMVGESLTLASLPDPASLTVAVVPLALLLRRRKVVGR